MKSIFLLLIICYTFSANGQTKEEILERHFEKMGTPAKWMSINTLKIESVNVYGDNLLSSKTSNQVTYAKRPMYAKLESTNKAYNNLILIGADSLGYWRKINNGEVSRPKTEGVDFTQYNLTMVLAQEYTNKENIQLKAKETLNEKEYYVLDVKNKNQRRLIYLDIKTYMIEAYIYINLKDGSKEYNVITFLSDYRDVKGFLFPFQSQTNVPSTKIKTITTDIQINIPIDNKIFSPESK